MKKTKIICTLGPSSSSTATISKLINAGMNVARINFSHGSHEEHQEKINNFNQARELSKQAVALLLDTKGPEIRVGRFKNDSEILEEQQKVLLSGESFLGDKERIPITYKKLYSQIKKGDFVHIDDGKIQMEVEEIVNEDIVCRVVKGGKVSNNKGVNIPRVKLNMDYMSDVDKSDVLFGIKNNVDYIAASFVRRADDVKTLRDFLNSNGGENIKIISKIENEEGIENINEIVDLSDGVMVARGDMAVEIDYERIPGIQKKIIKRCCELGKISVTATQMLESMTENYMPTRAEITDVANAVYDGTSAVMLSGETAVGKYPVGTVETMSRIINQAESDLNKYGLVRIASGYNKSDVSDAVGHSACQAAKDIDAKAILAVTISGYTAEKISKYKPDMPIIAATPSQKTFYQQALVWGVYPVLTSFTSEWDSLINEAIDKVIQLDIVKPKDLVVICAGMPLQETGKTNLMRIEQIQS